MRIGAGEPLLGLPRLLPLPLDAAGAADGADQDDRDARGTRDDVDRFKTERPPVPSNGARRAVNTEFGVRNSELGRSSELDFGMPSTEVERSRVLLMDSFTKSCNLS